MSKRLQASEQSERMLLGMILLEPSSMAIVRSQLTQQHFTMPHAVAAWGALTTLFDAGHEITGPAVVDHLERQGMSKSWAWMSELLDWAAGMTSSLEALVDILDERLARRRLSRAGDHLRCLADDPGDARLAFQRAISYLNTADERSNGSLRADLSGVVAEVLSAIKDGTEGLRGGLMTGFPSLDTRLMLHPGQLVLVEGRTSEGKSTLSQQIGLFNARLGRRVAFRSLEDARQLVLLRAVAQLWGVPLEPMMSAYLGRGGYAQATIATVERCLGELGDWPYLIEDEGRIDIGSVLGWAARLHALAPLDLLVIDYVGLMRFGEDRRTGMSDAALSCKEWAKNKGAVVFLLAQVTDPEPGRPLTRPQLGQVRDCRDLDHHADVVLAVHRPKKGTDEDRTAEVGILKQKNGWTGWLPMRWDGPTVRYIDGGAS